MGIKMWIAKHPTQPGNHEIVFTEPNDDSTFLESERHSEEGAWVQWKEYVCIPIEGL